MNVPDIILKRKAISNVLVGQNENVMVEYHPDLDHDHKVLKIERNNKMEYIKFSTSTDMNTIYDVIDKELGIKVDREHIMAGIVKKPSPTGFGNYPDDLYDAFVVFQDHSQTFRTPYENYCVCCVDEDGILDFSHCDAVIREAVLNKMRLAAPHLDYIKSDGGMKIKFPKRDNVYLAWLLSEYLDDVKEIKPVRMTVKEFQSVYASYSNGYPVHTECPSERDIA